MLITEAEFEAFERRSPILWELYRQLLILINFPFFFFFFFFFFFLFPRFGFQKEKAAEEEPEVDTDIAAMMGFGGFGSSKK